MQMIPKLLYGAATTLLCAELQAAPLPEHMQVQLLPATGEPVTVAELTLKPLAEGGYEYSLAMNQVIFSDQFLSMRPFKCLDAPQQMLCHLPYPYTKTSHITGDDLRNLEYDLLFIHRKPSDYGIDPWNGVYYQLTLNEDEGKIEGDIRAVDLDILAAPPAAGDAYPITPDDLHETAAETHAFPRLVIQQ
ncbi:MAG: hypothetical protein KJ914_02935 [Gammaproteobacteria bacterium]|nr:hypothetical protein [Gammaproteobacteria bacterium]MBU1725640.1 hypothetical protein [Gammaproteobacteria bacterium]MBU2004008.1 hypothetical protein [Gammaproteobacteria bacterium]